MVSPEGQAEPPQGDQATGSEAQWELKHEAWASEASPNGLLPSCWSRPGDSPQIHLENGAGASVTAGPAVQERVSRGCARLHSARLQTSPALSLGLGGQGGAGRGVETTERLASYSEGQTWNQLLTPRHRSPKAVLGGDTWTHHPRCWSGALRVGCPLGLPKPHPPGPPHPRPLTLAPLFTSLRSHPSPDPAPCPCTGRIPCGPGQRFSLNYLRFSLIGAFGVT